MELIDSKYISEKYKTLEGFLDATQEFCEEFNEEIE